MAFIAGRARTESPTQFGARITIFTDSIVFGIWNLVKNLAGGYARQQNSLWNRIPVEKSGKGRKSYFFPEEGEESLFFSEDVSLFLFGVSVGLASNDGFFFAA